MTCMATCGFDYLHKTNYTFSARNVIGIKTIPNSFKKLLPPLFKLATGILKFCNKAYCYQTCFAILDTDITKLI